MSYSQLLNLFIILGLISYSYEYNQRNNHIRRRAREAALKPNAQQIINKIFSDQGALEAKIREGIQKDEDIVKGITRNIMLAADKMAEVGVTDITSATQWTTIQGELRTGLNVIIDAYERYIELHRQSCEAIETFAKSMITKYEAELSTLNQLSAPTLTTTSPSSSNTSSSNTSSSTLLDIMNTLLNMQTYARIHQATLGTAIDSVGDLTKRTIDNQQAIFGPPTNTITIHVLQPSVAQTATRSIDLPCNAPGGYNGCQACSNAVAGLTQSYLCNAYPQQCPSQQTYY